MRRADSVSLIRSGCLENPGGLGAEPKGETQTSSHVLPVFAFDTP